MATRDLRKNSIHDDGDGSWEEMDDERTNMSTMKKRVMCLMHYPEVPRRNGPVCIEKRKRFGEDKNAFLQMTTDDNLSVIFLKITRTVRGSDYSPAIELSEQKDTLLTATGETEKYSEKQANKVWLNLSIGSQGIERKRNFDINKGQ